MATYEEEYAAVKHKLELVEFMLTEQQELKAKLVDELETMKRKKLEEHEGMTKKESLDLRRSLTILVNTLTTNGVPFATIRLVDADPEPIERGYMGSPVTLHFSFNVKAKMVMDYAMGFDYDVQICTKSEGVRRMVRHMIRQTGYVDDENDDKRTEWSIDWDYHRSIKIVDPLSDKDYYEQYNYA